jgi:hypothetical protein
VLHDGSRSAVKTTATGLLVVSLLLCGCSGEPVGRIVPVRSAIVPLAGAWRFAVDPKRVGVRAGWFRPGLRDTRWERVTVPHTWNVMPAHRDYSGLAWYRRSFMLPASSRDAHVRLRFDAVFYAARVWLNGRALGRHEGGYTPFELDATAAAKPGRNVVAVLVDNRRSPNRIPADITPTWSFDWWNYGGIVRDVSVVLTSRAYVAAQRIVAVPHLTGPDRADAATVTVTASIANASRQELRGTIVAVAAGAHGAAHIAVPAGGTAKARLVIRVAKPRLWHFDHPALYELTTTLRQGDAVLDEAKETFGVRSVELAHGKLLLNGEPVRLVGLTRHEDSPAHGLAETPRIVNADYADLKTLNEVLTRPVHYPQSPLVLDYADRHGILLVPEVPAWQLTRTQMADPKLRALEKQQLREMVASEANHPSVIAWSIGNELDSQTVEGWSFVKEMVETVKALDPTRPVGFASNRLDDTTPQLDATRFSDFVMMNEYFGSWAGPEDALGPQLDRVHAAFRDKPVIISEYGLEPHWYLSVGASEDSLDSSRYFSVSRIVPATSALADAERRRLIVDQLAVFRTRPWIVGAIFWTYQDYRTGSGFVMGAVDERRQRRGSWRTLRREYAPVSIERFVAGTVTLRMRRDLPSYTLRGYSLRWRVLPHGPHGSVALPVLLPGTTWSTRLAWQTRWRRVRLDVVRPTGFSAATSIYAAGR